MPIMLSKALNLAIYVISAVTIILKNFTFITLLPVLKKAWFEASRTATSGNSDKC